MTLSSEMKLLLKHMSNKPKYQTPGTSGFYLKTFNALMKRGLIERDHGPAGFVYHLTDKGVATTQTL